MGVPASEVGYTSAATTKRGDHKVHKGQVSNPKVHLQEDGCIYRYGIVCLTYISTMYYIILVYTTVFLKRDPQVQNT
jgi:hypothetical protein